MSKKHPPSPWGRALGLIGLFFWVFGVVSLTKGREWGTTWIPACLTLGLILHVMAHNWGLRRRVEALEDWVEVLQKAHRPRSGE